MLDRVLEVVELAISGSRSRPGQDRPVLAKEEKVRLPVSRRVAAAAEDLLSAVLKTVGATGGPSLSEQCSTALDEARLGEVGGPTCPDPWAVPTDGFRYYVSPDTTILALSQWNLPTERGKTAAIVIIRAATGKTVWRLAQGSSACSQRSSGRVGRGRPGVAGGGEVTASQPAALPAVPSPYPDTPTPPYPAHGTPSLEMENVADTQWNTLIDRQVEQEGVEVKGQPRCAMAREATDRSSLQTSRLLLSQLGILDPRQQEELMPLVELEAGRGAGLWPQLQTLDRLPTRTQDTLLVYYVREGQTEPAEILANSQSDRLSAPFLGLISQLGWQVALAAHPGWAGPHSKETEHILYWADEVAELAVLVPCQPVQQAGNSGSQLEVGGRQSVGCSPGHSSVTQQQQQQQVVVVVWLESGQDQASFPLAALLPGTAPALTVFLQPLQNGLVLVRAGAAVPLVEGAAAARAVLGRLVREAALNSCRRARLEALTPSARRRQAIHAVARQFGHSEASECEKITRVFL